MNNEFNLKKIDDYRWEIPKSEGMRVPGRLYADERMLKVVEKDRTPLQVKNVAYLPGIVKYSLAMPDMHWGYGFCIGGVAATDPEKGGVISPGGIGFDINCGVRLVRTNLTYPDIRSNIRKLLTALFSRIPCGVGSTSNLKLSSSEISEVLKEGAKWAVKKGFGLEEDLERTEENGAMLGANPEKVSQRAYKRGNNQLGTLGSGNHFLEIDEVEKIYDARVANTFGLFQGQIAVIIHTGSRGLGYQVCDDYLAQMRHSVEKYNISLPDRQLSCAPLTSSEGKDYFSAMAGAANYAWANRQMIMHWTREVFKKVLNLSPKELGMRLVYDVCHNIGKFEQHTINGKTKTVFVHRKGATRAFPAYHPRVPEPYQEVGQPVLVPGDMGTNSYVMVGTKLAMEETWGSTCHGAGRVMSRTQAKKVAKGRAIERELSDKGILIMAKGRGTIAEEMPEAYKDIDQVVNIVDKAGLSKKVAKLRPIAVIKG
ncbi:RtcB family protein [Candidatus Aerophobetes bacterium]|nr:RtcB family protein [Candidatus Aerophobetes bacterium]